MVKDNEAIEVLQNRIKCARCGAPMVRRICSKRKIKASWVCDNPECRLRVRISDTALLQKITIILNRIILNSDLLLPQTKRKPVDSLVVSNLQEEVHTELKRSHPSEEYITNKIGDMASQLYRESKAKDHIAAHIAKRRVMLMKPIEHFDCNCFSDLVDNILLDESGAITLITKTSNKVTEVDERDGC